MVIAKFFLGGAVKSDAPSNETVTADGRASPGAAAPLRITHTAHTPFTRGLRAPPSWSEVQRRHRLRDFVGAARGRDEAPRSQPQRVEPLVRAVEPGLRSHGASRPPRFSFARSLKNARGAGRCRSRRATDADRPLAGCDVRSERLASEAAEARSHERATGLLRCPSGAPAFEVERKIGLSAEAMNPRPVCGVRESQRHSLRRRDDEAGGALVACEI